MSSISGDLAKFVVETRFDDLPEEVVQEAKRSLLDSIGCAIAGIRTDKGKIAVNVAKRLGGPQESSIIGVGDRVSCSNAAFANGELINGLDYDAVPHVPPITIPPSLAIAESVRASGKDLIVATVLAQEIARRFSLALSNMMAKLTEEAKTPDAFGNSNEFIFGATAGVCKILNFGPNEIAHALGIAAYLCSLPICRDWEDAVPKSMVKYVPTGWISHTSVMAVLLAEQGYTGNPGVFDGRYGFWRFYGAERWDPERVVERLGQKWFFTEVSYKPYPCCRFFHSQLDCFISLIEKNNLLPDDIESVQSFSFPFVANPAPMDVKTQADVQFSLPFLFAVAAHRVRIGPDWQDWNTIGNPKIREFMKKVSMHVDPASIEAKRKDPRSWLARVEVTAKGKAYVEKRTYAKGTSFTDLRATDQDLMEKFKDNASTLLPKNKIDRAVQCLMELEKLKDVSELMNLVVL